MRIILLIAITGILLSSPSFGDGAYPLYNGKEYPVQSETLDKLRVLSTRADDLFNDIDQSKLPHNWSEELSIEMSNHLNEILNLLTIEEIHSEDRQFNIRAIREISLKYIGIQLFFKDVPESCNKLMGLSLATPADVLYLGKIKDMSREVLDLLQEIKEELSEFYNFKDGMK